MFCCCFILSIGVLLFSSFAFRILQLVKEKLVGCFSVRSKCLKYNNSQNCDVILDGFQTRLCIARLKNIR